jgi:DNA polymerase-3 subunit delta
MRVRELMAKIGKEPLPPVLLFGPGKPDERSKNESFEPLLAERAAQLIAATYVPEGMQDLAYRVFYADECQPGEIVLEAQTYPFLSERRVVLVRNAERYDVMSGERKSPLAALIEYLKSPAETTLLLLIASQLDKRKKFYKSFQALDAFVECPQLGEGDLRQWVNGEVQKKNKRIDPEAVKEIVNRAGNRLSDVNNAIELVTNYVGQAAAIRCEDVVAACSDVAEETIWALTDAIANSEPEKALLVLHQLLDMNKSPDDIMGTINWLLESAYRSTPASKQGLKSQFLANKVQPLVQKLGLDKLKAALALCTDTHFMLRSTGVDRDLALELLVIKLAGSRRRTAQA